MSDALTAARSFSDSLMHRARRGRKGPEIFASGASGGRYGQSRPFAYEQLRHNYGHTYAASQIIVYRIAAQSLVMAEVLGPAKDPRKPGARKDFLPSFVKEPNLDLEFTNDHEVLKLLMRPNSLHSGYVHRALTVWSLLLTGVGYWWITDDGIYFLASDWVRPIQSESEIFDSYEILPRNTGEAVVVDASEVVRFALPDPLDPFLGQYGPLQANTASIVTDEAIQRSQAKAMNNGLRPGLAVIVGREPDISGAQGKGNRPILRREQRAQLVAALKQQYAGSYRDGEPIILDGMIEDVKPVTLTPREIDFNESAKNTEARIYMGFGVNPISAGKVEGANRASSAIADSHLVDNRLAPLCELISATLTFDLLPRLGVENHVLYVEPPRTHDPESQRADRQQLLSAGVVTRNEVRQWLDMEPLPGPEGDELVRAGKETAPSSDKPPAPAGSNGNGRM